MIGHWMVTYKSLIFYAAQKSEIAATYGIINNLSSSWLCT